MRRIINSTFVSLDGIINHMEAWHFEYSDDEAERIATEQIFAADAMLMGRHTYEIYANSWGISEGTYADRINSLPKYVVSTTLDKADWANTKVLSGDLVEEVSRLKQEPGGEILTHGFGSVAKTLLAHRLLDELHLWVHPVFAGVGTTADMLFNPGMNVRLNLVGNRPLASGQIILTYQPVTREVTTMTTIEVEQREPQPVLSIRQTVPVAELTQAQGASLHELWQLLHDRGVAPTGPPFVRYHTFGDAETDVETGVPVGDAVAGAGRISRGELPGGRAVTTVHLGAHDRLGDAYNRIREWLAAHGQPAGPAWEVYEWIDLTREPDPSSWPAPADWRTQLVQPVT